MRLTTFSDYALRLLLYAAAADDHLVTIEEAATTYGVSRAHLMKVANLLARAGYLRAVRGRSGGLSLGRSAQEIRLGEVIQLAELDFALVECFSANHRCIITRLKIVLGGLFDSYAAIWSFRFGASGIGVRAVQFGSPMLRLARGVSTAMFFCCSSSSRRTANSTFSPIVRRVGRHAHWPSIGDCWPNPYNETTFTRAPPSLHH